MLIESSSSSSSVDSPSPQQGLGQFIEKFLTQMQIDRFIDTRWIQRQADGEKCHHLIGGLVHLRGKRVCSCENEDESISCLLRHRSETSEQP